MNQSMRTVEAVYGNALGAQARQRVLRNTYAMLALSMARWAPLAALSTVRVTAPVALVRSELGRSMDTMVACSVRGWGSTWAA